MKRMTKNLVKELLMGDYMDALAYFAEKLAQYNDAAERLEKIDEKVWAWCEEYEEDYDFMESWLRVYSALICAIES